MSNPLKFLVVLTWIAPAGADPSTYIDPRPTWGVEVDLVQPVVPTVHIIKPKLARSLWGVSHRPRGDLLVSVYIRPHIEHDVVETIDEYMLGVGYRQYVWRGLHAEALVEAGAAWGTNKFDGMDYTTPTLFAELNVGYRLGWFEPGGLLHHRGQTVGLYVAPQIGTLFGLGVHDIGPRNGKPDWFLQGNLLVGASF